MSECEGFICPYCLVSFSHQTQLEQHFVEMHSGQGVVEQDDYDEVEYVEDEVRSATSSPSASFHQFKPTPVNRPRSCDLCSEIIWHEGLVCQACLLTIHMDICQDKVSRECPGSVSGTGSPSNSEDILPGERERKSSMSQQLGINKGLLNIVKTQVSKGRNRYQNEEFDLDLTYITERIIAMSFPASNVVESTYRNSLKDVAKMLKTKHQDNYMVFNLSERSYDISRFNNQVLDFGWPDHLAPSLERLSSVCKSIKSWLDSDPQHVAVVHCKGGKGRTGCVIAAFMHYTEICHSAAAALDRFAMKRFYDNKCGGVTQPSQRKYVHHFADLLAGRIDFNSQPVVLHYVLLHGIPNFDGRGGCRIFLKIYENMTLVHTSGLFTYTVEDERIKISIYEGLQLQGEVLLKCFHKRGHTGMDSVLRCQFPTAIVKDDLRLVYGKADLDDSYKDKRFPDIKMELLFREAESGGSKDGAQADVRSSLLDSKSSSSSSPHAVSSSDLSHDKLAQRNSYAAFAGGSDEGVPLLEEVPDLMGHESPVVSRRDRSETAASFKMNPEDLERVTHQDDVYTVVSKQFKQSQREADKTKQEPPKPRPKLRPSRSIDQIDSGGSSRPPKPAVPPHKARVTSHMVQQGAGPASGWRGNGIAVAGNQSSPYSQPILPPSSYLPPPQIIKKQQSADHPFISQATPISARPPSAPLLDNKYDIDYEEIDESESPPPSSLASSDGNFPGHHDKNIRQWKQEEVPGKMAPQPPGKVAPQPRPKPPVPAAKPMGFDMNKENKKHELHLKYKKIQDDLIRKQEAAEGQHPRGRGHSKGDVASTTPTSGVGGGVTPRGNGVGLREQKNFPRSGGKQEGGKLKHRPSYAEVDPEQEITVEEFQGEGEEAALWGLVRYPGAKKGAKPTGLGAGVGVGGAVAAAVEAMSRQQPQPQLQQRREDSLRRSSSSSNLIASDFYSNLTDLELEPASHEGQLASGNRADSLGKKSHSFSEGLDKLVIPASSDNRASDIIGISGIPQFPRNSPVMDHGNFMNPDYKNLQYDEDGNLNLEPDAVPAPSFIDQIKMLGRATPTQGRSEHCYENTVPTEGWSDGRGPSSDDYVNDSALDDVHNYTNHDDLLEQLQAENIPQPEEVERALESSQRLRLGSGASLFKLLKTSLLKPKQPTEIHSSTISNDLGTGTLAPFTISGVNIGRVNKDYEAFKGSAWVDYSETPATTSGEMSSTSNHSSSISSNVPKVKSPHENLGEQLFRQAREEDRERRPRPSPPQVPLNKHRAKTDAAALAGGGEGERPRPSLLHSPQFQRKAGVPLPPPPNKRLPVAPPANPGGGGTAVGNSLFHRPIPDQRPSPQNRPLPASPKQSASFFPSSPPPPLPGSSHNHLPRPHNRLQASQSDAPAPPKPRVKESDRAQSSEPHSIRGRKPGPPKPPLPFHQHAAEGGHVSEAQVRMLMHHWYRPNISREEAISLVLPRTAGSFIVRDSSTVKGGYALTLKITEVMVRHRKKMGVDDTVTEDMLVTHFLIQPDPQGVKLQGWSEKPFKSLPAFIASHVQEKLCLPCKLVLPEQTPASTPVGVTAAPPPPQGMRRQPSVVTKALQSGASCELIYLGSVDVTSAGSDALLAKTVQQLQGLDLSTMNIVTITVSRDGVSLQEDFNGSLLKRQYPFNLVTYCGLDPNTRWNFPSLHHRGETVSLTDKLCFGLVHRPPNMYGFSCMVFAEYTTSQPVSSVVNFIQKMMKEHKHSSKFSRS